MNCLTTIRRFSWKKKKRKKVHLTKWKLFFFFGDRPDMFKLYQQQLSTPKRLFLRKSKTKIMDIYMWYNYLYGSVYLFAICNCELRQVRVSQCLRYREETLRTIWRVTNTLIWLNAVFFVCANGNVRIYWYVHNRVFIVCLTVTLDFYYLFKKMWIACL